MPSVAYGYGYKQVKPPFVIFDIRAFCR